MSEVDVLVVGAGLAGLSCAARLVAAGARVAIVDRKLDVGRGVQTTGIFVRKTLEDFELPAAHLGPAVSRVVLYSPRRRRLELSSDHVEFRVARMGALYGALLGRCVDAGAVWWPGTRYLGSSPAGDGSVVTLARRGREARVWARVIVGADGALSRVAADLGLEPNRRWIVGVEDVFERRGGAPALHCFLDPVLAPGYLAWVADDGEELHVGVGGDPRRFRPREALETFRAYVAAQFALRGAPRRERRGGRIPVGGILRRIGCARGLLVGDAAGAVSPLTAGGLDGAIRLSELAAAAVAARLRGGDPGALARYAGDGFRRRFVSRRMMRALLGGVRSPALHELGLAAARAWPLRGLVRHVFFGRGSFPDLDPRVLASLRAGGR